MNKDTNQIATSADKRLINFFSRPPLHVCLLVTTVFALYLPTLSFPFIFDDLGYLLNNPLIKGYHGFALLWDIPGFVKKYTPLVDDSDYAINFILRPLSYLTFCINYTFGGFETEGYRIFNIMIHAANALFVYLFVFRLLSSVPVPASRSSAIRAAFFSAMLFAVNPLQTQSVTYIIQRFTSLATCFYLMTLYAYLQSITTEKQIIRRLWYLLSLALLVSGMLVKEFLFTAPLMMLAMDILVMRRRPVLALRHALPHILCMPIIPVMILLIAQGTKLAQAGVNDVLNVVNFNAIPPWHYFLTEMRAIFSYFRLLLLPYNQNIDHVYPLFTSPLEPQVVISASLIVLFIYAAWRLCLKNQDSLAHISGFFILWYFIAFSVDSTIVPLPDLVSEHRSYFPSIGLFAGLVIHAERVITLRSWVRGTIVCVTAGIVICAVYATLTVIRHRAWSSLENMWIDSVQKCPTNVRAWSDLGSSYKLAAKPEQAEYCYRRALAIKPHRVAFICLGQILVDKGRYLEAVNICREGLISFKGDPELLTGVGVGYYHLNKFEASAKILNSVVSHNPRLTKAREYLAMAKIKLAE